MVRIVVDRERCQGHGTCYGHFPDLFEPDDEGYSVVVDSPTVSVGCAHEAASGCPEGAIRVED